MKKNTLNIKGKQLDTFLYKLITKNVTIYT